MLKMQITEKSGLKQESLKTLRLSLLKDSIANGYAEYNFNLDSLLTWHRYERILKEVSTLSPGGLILDVGCGFGQMTEMLRLSGIRSIGLDLGAPGSKKKEWTNAGSGSHISTHKESNQNKVWKHLRSPFILGDGCTLPLATGFFDAVVCCGTLEHVYEEKKLLMECHRVLTGNGLFLCYFLPNKTGFESLASKYFSIPTIHKFYNKALIESLFKDCGYDILDISREHLIPEPHFVERFKIWNKSQRILTWADDVLSNTQLDFFGDNWRIIARKSK
jgi:ubiquinone/menaquinone biosynthesis C-methylase UbiE